MSTPSLQTRAEELERRLLAGAPIGPSADIPFALFVSAPDDELHMRQEIRLLATRLKNAGRPVTVVDLGKLLWECLEDHPLGSDALIQAELSGEDLHAILQEGHALLIGPNPHEPGPLERR